MGAGRRLPKADPLDSRGFGGGSSCGGGVFARPGPVPGLARLLTTTTVNAKELAERLDLAEFVRLAPVDRPGPLARFVKRWAPRALVLVETELWPHWLKGLSEKISRCA